MYAPQLFSCTAHHCCTGVLVSARVILEGFEPSTWRERHSAPALPLELQDHVSPPFIARLDKRQAGGLLRKVGAAPGVVPLEGDCRRAMTKHPPSAPCGSRTRLFGHSPAQGRVLATAAQCKHCIRLVGLWPPLFAPLGRNSAARRGRMVHGIRRSGWHTLSKIVQEGRVIGLLSFLFAPAEPWTGIEPASSAWRFPASTRFRVPRLRSAIASNLYR